MEKEKAPVGDPDDPLESLQAVIDQTSHDVLRRGVDELEGLFWSN